MKKILFTLLLFTGYLHAQTYPVNPTKFGKISLNTNGISTSTSKINTQESNGEINYIDAINLPIPTSVINAIKQKSDLSTGLLKNGLISINADPTKFNLSAGIGIISNFTNPETPVSTIINFPAFTAVTPTYLTSGNITYVAINSTPAVVMQAFPFTPDQRRDLIVLGAVVHSNLTNINVVNNISAPSNAVGNQLHDFIEAVGALNLTGNKYSANGANLSLNKSAGTIFKFGVNFANNWKNPHEISQSSGSALTFRYRTQNGTEGTDRTTLNPTVYDLNNVLTSVPNNKFTIQTVTMFQTGLTRLQYGQNYYDNIESAQAAIFTRDYNVEANINENGITRAYIILKNNATSLLTASDSKIVEAQKFGGIASGGVALTFANIVSALGYTPENISNKTSSYTVSSTTIYPNTKALVDGLATKIDENFIRYLLVGTNKAYKTIQQAIDAATNGDHILIDQGVYTNFLLPNTLKNITIEGIVGSKFSRDTQQWSEGVLVQGECSNNSSYSTIKNIGFSIPSGSAGNNIGTSTTLGHVKYIDCDFSGNSLSQPDHNILLNDGDYALFLRCNFYNSFHGLAIKVSYVNVEDCNFFDHGADLLIIRADNGMTGVHPYVHDINIVNCHLENKIEDRDGIYGVLLDSQNDGTVIDNVNIVNVSTKLLGFGFITAGSTLESISNINLTNCSADSCNDGLKLLGAKNVTISGWKSKNSVVNGIENFNVSGVQVTGANFENDNIPYNGNVSGFFRDNLFNSGINTSQPKSNFQVFDANGNGDRMSIYANGQSDGSGATLDFPMTLPDQTPNSIIARLRAKAFNGSSINSLEVYIGNWANSNNPGSIKSRWLSNGVFDHLGQIQLRGGSPTATSLLVSTNTDGLATWQEKASLGFATTDSPALTGVPTSPTATAGTNTTQIATTAFVFNNTLSLSGNQTFTGTKSSTVSGSSPAFLIENTGLNSGVVYKNINSGIINRYENWATGVSSEYDTQTGVTGDHMQFKNLGVLKSKIDVNGRYSIEGGSNDQYIMADGSTKTAYKVWTGTLNQVSTGAPTTTIFENSVGAIVWTRITTGMYWGTLVGAFPASKTHLSITPSSPTGSYSIYRNTDDVIVVQTKDTSLFPFVDSDDKLFNNSIEIRVYN